MTLKGKAGDSLPPTTAYFGHADQLVRSHGYQQSERSDAGSFFIAQW